VVPGDDIEIPTLALEGDPSAKCRDLDEVLSERANGIPARRYVQPILVLIHTVTGPRDSGFLGPVTWRL
jgi:hypothetical protein